MNRIHERIGKYRIIKENGRGATAVVYLAETPDYPVIRVEPGEPFEIEGLAVGLTRNTMLM